MKLKIVHVVRQFLPRIKLMMKGIKKEFTENEFEMNSMRERA